MHMSSYFRGRGKTFVKQPCVGRKLFTYRIPICCVWAQLATKDDKKTRDIYSLLDYYTKSALSHSGFILVCLFGLFSLLTLMARFQGSQTVGAMYTIFVSVYSVIVSFGIYEIRRWGFYSSRAKYIADFIKVALKKDTELKEEFLKRRILEPENKDDYENELLLNEWVAVGREGEKKGAVTWIFDHAEFLFYVFFTVVLIGFFEGTYGMIENALSSLSFPNAVPPTWCLLTVVLYVLISLLTYFALRRFPGAMVPGHSAGSE